MRLLVFKSIVVSTLLSSVVALALLNKHYTTMQSFICKLARKLLKSMATHTDDSGTNTITNIDALHLIGLFEIHIEIAIHRLKWFSKIC